MKKCLIGYLATILLLAGCTPEVVTTTPEEIQALVDGVKFAKSSAGVCFGVVTVSRIDSGGKLAYNQMIVYIPCKEAGL